MKEGDFHWVNLETIQISKSLPNVLFIRFNRPESYNSINHITYKELLESLKEAQHDPDIRVVVVTGKGAYYSSGHDLKSLSKDVSPQESMIVALQRHMDITREFIRVLIDFDKILIAAVNGPAVGIMVTTMTLYDFVYVAQSATFMTPFTRLAFCPEGCSSILFPLLMGYAKANELLVRHENFL
jgi:peroxisomal 3,2-trans-enoyl-CoA isomerase